MRTRSATVRGSLLSTARGGYIHVEDHSATAPARTTHPDADERRPSMTPRRRDASALAILCICLTVGSDLALAQSKGAGLSPSSLSARLAAKPTGEDGKALAEEVRAWFGKPNLLSGP